MTLMLRGTNTRNPVAWSLPRTFYNISMAAALRSTQSTVPPRCGTFSDSRRPRRDRSANCPATACPPADKESLQYCSLPRGHARNSALELLRRAAHHRTIKHEDYNEICNTNSLHARESSQHELTCRCISTRLCLCPTKSTHASTIGLLT